MEKKKMVITYEALCKDCGGSGHCQSEPCRLCGATGYVDIMKNIDITVGPSFTREVKFKSETFNKNKNGQN
ncbi:MAG: hypothetical protein RBS07_07650 [Lentimicrobium sp.]|jgi:DnaJ-class molecular chaperone|nr:hypothetical protein [Lentimicrobium sp.]